MSPVRVPEGFVCVRVFTETHLSQEVLRRKGEVMPCRYMAKSYHRISLQMHPLAKELLILGGILAVSTPLVIVALRKVMGNNLTVRLYIGLVPAITLLVVLSYFWANVGGVHNMVVGSTMVPAGMAIVIGNFILVGKTLIRRIGRVSEGLSNGAHQVSDAAGQMAQSSNKLAESSTQQAAAVQETSASIEEMAAMTTQNADNAGRADSLMSQTVGYVSQAQVEMGNLSNAFKEISQASIETQKIVKTIDEIAFQTNLLALNAAVEAARAGEAGAGFAVVADEVRNLAVRAAEAAKNTSSLINDISTRIDGGAQMAEKTNTAFRSIADSTSEVGQLVTQISEASRQQAQGTGQINKATSEMDAVVQNIAASAEETAAAAQEMHAQSESMNQAVGELNILIEGEDKRNAQRSSGGVAASRPAKATAAKTKTFVPEYELAGR